MIYDAEQTVVEAVKQELAALVVPLTAGGLYPGRKCGEKLFARVAEGAAADLVKLPSASVCVSSDATQPDTQDGSGTDLRVEVHIAVGALSPGECGSILFLRNIVYEAFDKKRALGGIANHYITEVRRDAVTEETVGGRLVLRSVVYLDFGLFKAE